MRVTTALVVSAAVAASVAQALQLPWVTAPVPARLAPVRWRGPQKGPTCGLYALAMAFELYHERTAGASPCCLVRDDDATFEARFAEPARGKVPPSADAPLLLPLAQSLGFTCRGEHYVAEHLAEVCRAVHPGYSASAAAEFTLEGAAEALDKGCPVCVAYDAGIGPGDPQLYAGAKAHWALLEGYSRGDDGKVEGFTATHSKALPSNGQHRQWDAAKLLASSRQLRTTGFYDKKEVPPPAVDAALARLDGGEGEGGGRDISATLAGRMVVVEWGGGE